MILGRNKNDNNIINLKKKYKEIKWNCLIYNFNLYCIEMEWKEILNVKTLIKKLEKIWFVMIYLLVWFD